ncbi:uncharacterized protein BX663DRAFT_200239 [Cokeromyces recurvatus]|uniref:uncharacterized protein n=1 Tax=Cokeromyces recurvatus TaxID=90255 RepID=UPI0022205005|nr:uncharacterized protein BX663DRAFT_200239 [Cokeromyces recurvatus]KAI7906643.1 hypothetical protein BX663DRAFT_200239 [Cokeromyces recurvatus]
MIYLEEIKTENTFNKKIKYLKFFLNQQENEDTCNGFDNWLQKLAGWISVKGVARFSSFVESIKILKDPICKCLGSSRNAIAASASDVLAETAVALGTEFIKLNDLFVNTVIKELGRNNKIHTTKMLQSYKRVIEHAKLPRLLPFFCEILTNKVKHKNNTILRRGIIECLVTLVNSNDASQVIKFHSVVENAIRVSSLDADQSVRSSARFFFQSYSEKPLVQRMSLILTSQ